MHASFHCIHAPSETPAGATNEFTKGHPIGWLRLVVAGVVVVVLKCGVGVGWGGVIIIDRCDANVPSGASITTYTITQNQKPMNHSSRWTACVPVQHPNVRVA